PVRLAEGHPEVADQHERLRAHAVLTVLVVVFCQADEALLLRLAVGVLHDRREQLQGVAVRARCAAYALIDQFELGPGPSRVRVALDGIARHLSLDRGWIERHVGVRRPARLTERIKRASPANHPYRVHPVRPEAKRPEE